jgi:hypothetical protein
MGNCKSYSKLPQENEDKICYKYKCQLAYNETKQIMRWKSIINGDIKTCNMMDDEILLDGEKMITINRYYLPDIQIGFHFTPNMEADFSKSQSYYYPLTTLSNYKLDGLIEKKISKKIYDKIVKSYIRHQKYITNNMKYNPAEQSKSWTEKQAEEFINLNRDE